MTAEKPEEAIARGLWELRHDMSMYTHSTWDAQPPHVIESCKQDVADVLAALKAAGWAVVPRKATLEMHNAGAFSDGQSKPPKISAMDDGTIRVDWSAANPSKIWSAMLAAAEGEQS